MMKHQLAAVADVDARAFTYPLAALAKKVGWELDAKTAELARAAGRLHEKQGEVRALEDSIEAATREVAARIGGGLNPLAHQTHLQYLVQRKTELHAARIELATAEEAHEVLRTECAALHARMEGLSRHRDTAYAAFVQEAGRKQSSERDRDWLARGLVLHSAPEGGTA